MFLGDDLESGVHILDPGEEGIDGGGNGLVYGAHAGVQLLPAVLDARIQVIVAGKEDRESNFQFVKL